MDNDGCQIAKQGIFKHYAMNLLIVPCFFIFFKMIFLISFNYKKLDFPCFFSKKYAMINVVLINNLFFISNILIFY